jgi:hypothetical protein
MARWPDLYKISEMRALFACEISGGLQVVNGDKGSANP